MADTHSSHPEEGESSALGEGKTVGRYVLRRMLGHGGMGLVFVAEDPQLKREVALKLMRSATPGAAHLARFEREAQAMARLSHRNVVAVFDYGLDEGEPWLVMELVRGASLREWMKVPRRWEEVVRVLVEAGRGLEAAHAAGLVHRDFKPENVLVADDGRVAVTDFGIARLLEATPEPLTAPQAVIGTPGYIAPEQLTGRGADARSDVYALGVVLHECLTGSHPGAREQAAPPASGGPPRYLLDIAARAMRPLPEERFASVRELLDAVERKESPGLPRPRRPLALAAGLAALAALVLLAGWLGLRRSESARAPVRSPSPAAAAAFDEGVALWKEGSTAPAARRLAEAVAADPALASGHLWLALVDPDPARAREAFGRARLHRPGLAAEEQVLLAALEPGQVPLPDLERWRAATEAAAREHPGLPLLQVLRAEVLARMGEAEPALAAMERAVALDATLSTVGAAFRGKVERDRHASPQAVAAWSRCLEASPRATDCLAGRARLAGLAGDCAAMAADARAWAAADPHEADADLVLANAFHAQGVPWAGVQEALRARREKLSPLQREKVQWNDEVNVAAMRGDFELARERAQAQVDAVPASAGFAEHYLPNFRLSLVLREMGDDAAAGKLSSDFLGRVSAWRLESARELALVLLFLRTARRTGYLEEVQYREQRERQLAAVDAALGKDRKADAYSRSIAWVVGYAAGASTPEEGKEALAALPRYEPLPPPSIRGTDVDLVIGIVHQLTGKPELALPRFEQVVRSCYRLENPFAWVYGQFWKGEAHRARGEKDEAARAYREVTRAWGSARPRSQMAERAQRAVGAP